MELSVYAYLCVLYFLSFAPSACSATRLTPVEYVKIVIGISFPVLYYGTVIIIFLIFLKVFCREKTKKIRNTTPDTSERQRLLSQACSGRPVLYSLDNLQEITTNSGSTNSASTNSQPTNNLSTNCVSEQYNERMEIGRITEQVPFV